MNETKTVNERIGKQWLQRIERFLRTLEDDLRRKELQLDEMEVQSFTCHSTKVLYEDAKRSIDCTRSQMRAFVALINSLRSLEERFDAVLSDFDQKPPNECDFEDNAAFNDGYGEEQHLALNDAISLIKDVLHLKKLKINELETDLEAFPSFSTKLLFNEVKQSVAKLREQLKSSEEFVTELLKLQQRFDAIVSDVATKNDESMLRNALTRNHVSPKLNDTSSVKINNSASSKVITLPSPTSSRKSIQRSPQSTIIYTCDKSSTLRSQNNEHQTSYASEPHDNHNKPTIQFSNNQMLRRNYQRLASNESNNSLLSAGKSSEISQEQRPNRRSKEEAFKVISGADLPRNMIRIRGSVVVFECPACRRVFTNYKEFSDHYHVHLTCKNVQNTRETNVDFKQSSTCLAPALASTPKTKYAPVDKCNNRSKGVPIVVTLGSGLFRVDEACQDLQQEVEDIRDISVLQIPIQTPAIISRSGSSDQSLAKTSGSSKHQLDIDFAQHSSPKKRGDSKSGNAKPGYLTCAICDATKYYCRVTTRFGQYACEPCYRQYVKYLKNPLQFYCFKDGKCKVTPSDVTHVSTHSDPCQGCWLKACIEKFIIDKNVHDNIVANFMPKICNQKSDGLSGNDTKLETKNDYTEDGLKCIVCDCTFEYRSNVKQNYLSELFGIFCCDRCDNFLTQCVNNGNISYTCKFDGNCEINREERCNACWFQKGLKTFDLTNSVTEEGKDNFNKEQSFTDCSNIFDKNNTAQNQAKSPGMQLRTKSFTKIITKKPQYYQKRVKCPYCGQSYTAKHSLQYHLAVTHPTLVKREDLPPRLKRIHSQSLDKFVRTIYPHGTKSMSKKL
ncbi:uncharacterized protein B4U79_17903 [Dinothrombium tinctorium]|uniref:C2H2-type domain-containing protein n=1 Tax=Dinothrombium tinctorium TaxID=1965070 RepID=A0A443RK05_9ACAR|nr:uncharacterized protein B4U79_17903 [Dinothrombium tinctorium]